MSEHEDQENEWRQLVGFGRALREARVRRGLGERGLSAAVERPLEDILALETGDLDPPYDLMLALAEQTGVPLNMLVCRAERLQDQEPPWRSPLVE